MLYSIPEQDRYHSGYSPDQAVCLFCHWIPLAFDPRARLEIYQQNWEQIAFCLLKSCIHVSHSLTQSHSGLVIA